MDWRHEAACRDKDPDIFFPDGSASSAPIEVAMAKAVCRNCPVMRRCRDWAIETEQADGIWGAMTARERRKAGKRLVEMPERRSA